MADMQEDDDNIIIAACWTIVSAAVGANYQVMQPRQWRQSCWVRGYLLQRSEYGAYNCLISYKHTRFVTSR